MKNLKYSFKHQTLLSFTLMMSLALTSMTLNAQFYEHLSQEEKEQKSLDLIKEAPFFIKGKATNVKYFYGNDGLTIYQKVTIEVINDFKGNIQSDSIYVILKGGRIGMDAQYEEHYRGPSISLGPKYFLMLQNLESYDVNKYVRSEAYEFIHKQTNIDMAWYSRSKFDNWKIKGHIGLKIDSEEDYLRFLSQDKDLLFSSKKKGQNASLSVGSGTIEITTDLSQLTVRAGIGDILTINGSGFGTDGNILFVNGDNPTGENPRLEGLDDIYVVSWTDTEIKVIVPSRVFESNSGGSTAGSGTIIVQRTAPTMEEFESNTQLNIEYSLKNFGSFDQASQDFYPMQTGYLALTQCFDGMTFTLHTSFEGNQPAIDAVETALDAWSNKLGITLDLEMENGEIYFHDDYENAHRNMIYFDPEYDPNLGKLMGTTSKMSEWDDCNQSCFPASFRWIGASIKVAIKDNWAYNVSGDTDFGKTDDFYHAILHEIGHAIGLDHDIDLVKGLQNLMSYSPFVMAGFLPEEDRVNLDQFGARGVSGGIKEVDVSQNHIWSADFPRAKDYYIQINPDDFGRQPYQGEYPIWVSKDIWIRNADDGGTEHQDPTYDPTDPNEVDYVYVRIRNRGCEPVQFNKLNLYWSKASTGLEWPLHWRDFIDPETGLLAGDEITDTQIQNQIDVGIIEPGKEKIFVAKWVVPNPELFPDQNKHYCLLARMLSSADQISFFSTHMWEYVPDNNNVAWKNVALAEGTDQEGVTRPSHVWVRKLTDDSDELKIKVQSNVPNPVDVGDIIFYFDDELHTKWTNKSSNSKIMELPNKRAQFLSNNAELIFNMNQHERHTLGVSFNSNSTMQEDLIIDLLQEEDNQIVGGERFIFKPKSQNKNVVSTKEIIIIEPLKIYPNPTNADQININMGDKILTDPIISIFYSDGSLVMTKGIYQAQGTIQFDISDLTQGTYIIRVESNEGLVKYGKFIVIR